MILVDIYVPSLGETFDFRVDETVTITNVVQEISEMLVSKYRSELNKDPSQFMLCAVENAIIMNNNTTLSENNITNGSKLLMV